MPDLRQEAIEQRRAYLMEVRAIESLDMTKFPPQLVAYLLSVRRARYQSIRQIEKRYQIKRSQPKKR